MSAENIENDINEPISSHIIDMRHVEHKIESDLQSVINRKKDDSLLQHNIDSVIKNAHSRFRSLDASYTYSSKGQSEYI